MGEQRANTGRIVAVIVIVIVVIVLLMLCCSMIGECGPILLAPNISRVFSQVNSSLAAP